MDGVTQNDIASILGRHGDTVTISIAGAGQVSLEVDGEGPDLDEITPEHDSAWRSGRLDFSFEVRDDDSGLRHDGELVRSADGDDTQVNGDRDQVTSGEPLTVRSAGQIAVNGKAADISLRVGSMSDITDIGRWTLLGSRPGVAYEFSARGNNFDEGPLRDGGNRRDRAGNETMSVGWYDEDDMPQPYTFTIDDTEPSVRAVQAGVGYDTREEKEVPDRKSIMVDFGEPLRSGIDHEQFTVSGHRVVGIVHPGRLSGDEMAVDIEGNPIDDPRSRIYLQLADELASDETPDVLLFGGIVYDLAGNPNDSVDRTAEDIVAPLFRVGVAALAEGATLTPGPPAAREEGKGRLVANGDGEFVVDVRSDEEVRRRPTVYFVGIDTVEGTKNGTKTGKYVYSIRSVQTGGALVEQEDPLHWRRAYEASRLTGLGELIGVIVSAEDENRNVFSTPGWKPESRQDNPSDDDVLDVEAMDEAGLLLELDTDFNDDATPEVAGDPAPWAGRRRNGEREADRGHAVLRRGRGVRALPHRHQWRLRWRQPGRGVLGLAREGVHHRDHAERRRRVGAVEQGRRCAVRAPGGGTWRRDATRSPTRRSTRRATRLRASSHSRWWRAAPTRSTYRRAGT